MNLNTLNSKINLPSVVSKLGLKTSDYDFVRVPMFGWYGKHKTEPFIGSIVDFFTPEENRTLFGTLSKNFSDCFEFPLPYSEYAEKKLFNEYKRMMQFQSAWIRSKEEAQTHKVRDGGQTWYMADLLDKYGMPKLLENQFGYLSDNVVRDFPELGFETKQKYRKVLVIPSFCTPKHICSLEVAKLQEINVVESLWVNGEKGWYGQHGVEILGGFNDMKVKVGCTWDSKLDCWSNNVLKIADNIPAQQVIKIWSEAHNTRFERDPVEELIAKSGSDDIKNHVALLSYGQIEELEKKSGQKLFDYWVKSKEQQYVVHGTTFVRRGTSYYYMNNGDEEQLSNFCLDIDEIRRTTTDKGVEFIWCGTILHKQDAIPFEMADRYFTSAYLFSRGIRQKFMSLGIGIPFINERYIKGLMTLIQFNCFNVKIVNT